MFTRSSRVFSLGAALTLAGVLVTTSPVPAAAPVTVGQFASRVARALGVPAADEEAAATNLRMAGAHLDPDLNTPLTEGRAADIMKDLGVPALVSGNPQSPMTPGKADQAATTVALSMASEADGMSVEGMSSTCSGVRDRASCYSCCSSILLPRSTHPLRVVLLCGVICAKLFPPVSAWMPLPPSH